MEVKVQKVIIYVRRVCLHTSAFGFSADFAHKVLGAAMIGARTFEHFAGVIISYSAWAACIVVYMDGAKERLAHKHDGETIAADEDEIAEQKQQIDRKEQVYV